MHPDLAALIEQRREDLGLSLRGVGRVATERGYPLSGETVRRIVRGTYHYRIDDETIEALAAALEVSRSQILRAMHETRSQPLGEWHPPDSAHRLTFRQRRAVESLIAAMVEPNAEDQDIELVTVGDQGMVVAQVRDGRELTAEEVAENEEITAKSLDEMAAESGPIERFGRG